MLFRAALSKSYRAVARVSFSTRSTQAQPRPLFKSATNIAFASAIGCGVTLATLGIAEAKQEQANIAQIRSEISDIINDLDVVNPSVDDGAQGGGGGVVSVFRRCDFPMPRSSYG